MSDQELSMRLERIESKIDLLLSHITYVPAYGPTYVPGAPLNTYTTWCNTLSDNGGETWKKF